jgi:hypothetical protein
MGGREARAQVTATAAVTAVVKAAAREWVTAAATVAARGRVTATLVVATAGVRCRETTLKARVEVSAQARADSGGCSEG